MSCLYNPTEYNRLSKQKSRQNKATQMLDHIFNPKRGSKEDKAIRDFESKMKDVHHKKCDLCKSVSLLLETKLFPNGLNICNDCVVHQRQNRKPDELNLPIYKDHQGVVQHTLPDVLLGLTIGEQLLMQQISCFIPLYHMKFGQIGSRGHVCAFPQDISEVCNVLPRLPTEVSVVKVIKQYKDKESGSISAKTFNVRKTKVLNALRFLKQHSSDFKDVLIDESNLNWIENGVEQEIEGETLIAEDPVDIMEDDKGPSPEQIYDVEENLHVEQSFGYIDANNISVPKPKDNDTTEKIKQSINKSGTKATMNFPYVSAEPVDEFDTSIKLFCKAFPWLFPGGVGDFNEFQNEKITLSEWITKMLLYYDGQFAKDKMWCFYVYDNLMRHYNMNNGS